MGLCPGELVALIGDSSFTTFPVVLGREHCNLTIKEEKCQPSSLCFTLFSMKQMVRTVNAQLALTLKKTKVTALHMAK